MIPGLGKEQVTVGSAPDNDIVLAAPGVAPHHARIVKQNGQLSFVDLGAGPSFANGAPVAPNQPTPFDFRVAFVLGQVPLPLPHPSLAMMLMSPGQLQPPRGHVVVGREPSRASLVISHGAVSGQHATVMLDRMMVTDHGSTSGTYVAGQKIPPNQPTPVDPNGILTFGPGPVAISILVQFAQAVASSGVYGPGLGPAHAPAPGPAPAPAPAPGPAPGPAPAPAPPPALAHAPAPAPGPAP